MKTEFIILLFTQFKISYEFIIFKKSILIEDYQ